MNSHRNTVLLWSLVVLLPATSVLAQEREPGPEPASLTVQPEELRLQVGETAHLQAVVRDSEGAPVDAEVIYVSTDRRSVGVSDQGVVEAFRPGRFEIVALVPRPGEAPGREGAERDPLRAVVPVTVPPPPVTSLEFVDPPAAFYAHTRVPLELRVTDAAGAERRNVTPTFASSAPDVVSVNHLGTLTIHQRGEAVITASVQPDVTAELSVSVQPNPVASIDLRADTDRARTGDVIHFDASPRDLDGNPVDSVPVQFAFHARTVLHDLGDPGSGMITADGRFVADLPGEYTIVALAGNRSATATVAIEPRNVRREIEVLGQGRVSDRATSDLWVWTGPDGNDYAVTGTWGADGHAYFWDVSEPRNIQLVDTIKVDARTVNDVKVSADGRVAVISREGASNRRNGLVILDVSDLYDRGARVLARYDDRLTGGVHNVFIDGDHVYALSAGQRYDVIDIEDPANPRRVGSFELDTPGHAIHDVWVVDGIAYSSNWQDGVAAVDVGGGGAGGSPRSPVLLGTTPYPSGWNHAAFPFRSPSTGKLYLIAGDEAGLTGNTPGYEGEPERMQGWIHVFEWDEWDAPVEVARYRVPEAGSHNMWVDEEREILYVGYYQGGLRVVDISGELLGDLYRQGREIASFLPFDPEGFVPNAPFVWGAQPHDGTIFFSDHHSGLWAVRLLDPREERDEAR